MADQGAAHYHEHMKEQPADDPGTYNSAQHWRSAAAGDPAPTADDCTVLVDGTRIDSPEKGRAFLASVVAQLEVLNDPASAG